MKCEFDYCIYNRNFECYFDEVGIHALGMCEACTIVPLQEEKLEEYNSFCELTKTDKVCFLAIAVV